KWSTRTIVEFVRGRLRRTGTAVRATADTLRSEEVRRSNGPGARAERNWMSVVELQELEEVKVRLATGEHRGVLTHAEIQQATQELDLDETDLEELTQFFESQEIELVEDIDPATAASNEVEHAPDKRGRRAKKATLDLRPDMTTNSLQLFLKDIGKVRLLTAQEEVDLANRIERGDLDAKQKMVESIKRSAQAPVSLEKPVGDEEESEFGQFIADERAESPYERAAEILTKEALREALENLSYRERRVLELRYGLGGEHPRTLDEVGRTFNVTRERIRQIENQSLKKLQSLAEAQKLRDVA